VGQRVAAFFDVVIVDEAHEQGTEAQIVMWLLRDALAAGGTLKIVVMSATMDAGALSAYL
jgi:HrpA-like RNA helicase